MNQNQKGGLKLQDHAILSSTFNKMFLSLSGVQSNTES